MTTYKFLASDSASAMEEVVKKLGPDALIIATTKKGNKVEIEATNNVSSQQKARDNNCLLYTSPSPRDVEESRMPSSA